MKTRKVKCDNFVLINALCVWLWRTSSLLVLYKVYATKGFCVRWYSKVDKHWRVKAPQAIFMVSNLAKSDALHFVRDHNSTQSKEKTHSDASYWKIATWFLIWISIQSNRLTALIHCASWSITDIGLKHARVTFKIWECLLTLGVKPFPWTGWSKSLYIASNGNVAIMF